MLPPLAQLAVTGLGWRGAYLVGGALVFVVLVATAQVMRRDPESMSLHPDGLAAPAETAAVTAGGLALGAAIRTRAFWLLGFAFSATWMPVFVPLVHLVPFARDLGHSPLAAAGTISATGAGAVLGRLAMGAVSDRAGRRPTIAAAMVLQAVAFLAFMVARDLPALYATAVVFGFSYGTISTLVGFLFALAGSTAAWGTLAAGAIYDATGSYRPAFLLAAALNVVAVALLAACRPPRLRYTPAAATHRGSDE